jgi:Protein of unknown function (DUF3631)
VKLDNYAPRSEQTTRNQRRELHAVAERHGWHVVATYEEAPPTTSESSTICAHDIDAGHAVSGRHVGRRRCLAPRQRVSVGDLMQRRPADVQIERLDETNPPRAFAVREMARNWAARCRLNRDPEMPPQLRDRAADNWRPSGARESRR